MNAITFPAEWLSNIFIALVMLALNIKIFVYERKARRDKVNTITFTSNYSKWFSLSCIFCATLTSFFCVIRCLPVFCFLAFTFTVISEGATMTLMGFYQLDRLYFCFSQNKAYSSKGYPLWLFLLLFFVGCISLSYEAGTCIYLWSASLIAGETCFIDDEWHFHDSFGRHEQDTIWRGIVAAVTLFACWDGLCLCLYAYKVCYLRKHANVSQHGYNHILAILHRILFLTLLYEVVVLIGGVLAVIVVVCSLRINSYHYGIHITLFRCVMSITSTTMCLSMFLMQEHNTQHYKKCIALLQKLGVFYICCCCRSLVEHYDDLSQLDDAEQQATESSPITDVKNVDLNVDDNAYDNYCGHRDTVFETRDASLKMQHSVHVLLSMEQSDTELAHE
mmetsp:Transcript_6314/g.10016  ORF Transcript_6314/g.10016 Transcript_6314/m.10016 type:complete len:391 (+) Transcript_6314:42-1214(+)